MTVLLVRNDHLGDLVLCLPVADALRRQGHRVVLLVAETLKDLPGLGRVAHTVVWRRRGESMEEFAERLDAEDGDVMLSFAPGRENAALARRLRIPVKVGHGAKPYNWGAFNRFVTVRRSHPPVHETEYMRAFCREAGLEVRIDPEFRLEPEGGGLAVEGVRPGAAYVTVHPGGRGSAENLRFEGWMVLARRLAERLSGRLQVLLVLGPAEEDRETAARERLGGVEGLVVVSGLPLSGLTELLGSAEMTVSGSTGPMHLAAVLGTKTFSFFPLRRSQSAVKWRPLGGKAVWASIPRTAGELEGVAERVSVLAAGGR